ncbi:MAG: serine protease, partial [Gammaproteobacteria bacterium]|nr:serine protease [Gammaproteobacteria bacterium]
HNGTIITDGAGLIDIRNGFGALNAEDSKCPGFLDVCCKDPDFIPPPPPKQVYKPRCGRRNTAGVGARIQGFKADESQFAEWPHMCAVLHDKPDDNGGTNNLYKCGGSLIAPGVILTAAHCIKDLKPYPEQVKVRCGEWDTQNQIEPYPHQDRYGADIQIHPEFNPKNLANDFALIFMAEDYNLDFHVDTVCLPQPGDSFDYETCFATGWGKDKFGAAGEYQVILKEIALEVVPRDTCQSKLRGTRLGGKFKLDESFMCAGGEKGKDTCKGDGGSPFVCPRKNDPTHYEQAGIVAWGIGCGENGVPGVYADVSQAVCWIDMVMSCHYGGASGDYNTYWGYEQGQCGAWLEGKLSALDKQIEEVPRFAKIFQAQRNGYTQCNVNWLTAVVETETGPYNNGGSNTNNNNNNNNNNNEGFGGVDLGGFERDGAYSGTVAGAVDSGLGGSSNSSPEKSVAGPYSAAGADGSNIDSVAAVIVEAAKEAEPGPVY